ncbi:MAG: M20 family metallopeptidase [Anaerolineae bacterium]|nr:M20 family metallopeptidase [Candidatus Roseilinea sp.]MDW8449331.1 M20 family metallopeptidase [Anaerolineae bacterium]
MIPLTQLREEAEAMRDRLVAVRRDLHQHPELAFEEVRTAGIVADRLSALGYEVQTGVGKTGVVGVLEGGRPTGRPLTLLLRFDMDALPIQEAVDVPFKSQYEGKMHACGHDAHTSIGLGVAEMMVRHRDLWGGVAKFVFQPAEEIVGGALAMIRDGVLENPKPDRMLSMHVWATEEVGIVGMTDGPTLAASGAYRIVVRGRGAHGASPHLGADPVVAAAHIVTALQTIVARNVDPMDQGVVTVGSIHGGTAPNIIPDVVEMQGTIRAFKDEVMQLLRNRIERIAESVAHALGVEASVAFSEAGTPATVNDPAMAQIVRDAATALFGADRVRNDYRIMGAEDCAFFLQAAPGAYVFVGAGNKAKGMTEPHHSPRFQIDEDVLPISVALLTASAIRMLES